METKIKWSIGDIVGLNKQTKKRLQERSNMVNEFQPQNAAF